MSRGKIADDPFFVHKVKATNNTHKEKVTNCKKQNKPFKNEKVKSKNETEAAGDKKPFNKKKWRLQKYSKKYKLEQWENKRKKAVLREYYKSVKDDDSKFDVKKIYGETESETDATTTLEKNDITDTAEEAPSNSTNRKRKPHKKAHMEFLRIQEEKKKKKEEVIKKKAEKEEALKNYRQKKLEKFKKLNRKTRKGQPIMKERMELLLERIQKSVQNST